MGEPGADLFQLEDRYKSFIEQARWRDYIESISEDGLNWWFQMDTPKILAHLVPVQEFSVHPSELPLRVQFLFEAASKSIPYERMLQFYDIFIAQKDMEAAAGAAGAAVASIWDSGQDFSRYHLWLERIDSLLDAHQISPLARASLVGFKALMFLTAWDIQQAYNLYNEMKSLAEQTRSYPLLLYYAAACTYCLVWMGKLTQAEVLIRDMQVLCNQPESHIVAQAYFRASTGLFYYVSGQTEMAEKTLRQLLSLPLFEELPPPVYFLTYGHLLLTVARDADQTAFESVATKLRQKVVPEMNYFHGSYMHYNLSTAYLMAGQPHRALLHAKEAVDRASRSDSMVAQMMPPLAYGQALVDNNNYQEAIEVFNKWCRIWKKKHFNLFACSGFLELAYCYIQKGMLDEARKAFDSAVSSLPEGQDLLHLNRTRDFTQRIKASVYPSETSIEPSFEMENKPVCITTFGDLLIRLADTFIYDRKWRGGRTKTLLKALIVFGGSKVSYELLMDTLWPEMDGDIAENNLKVTLSRLRKVGVKRGQRPIKWILVKNRKVSLAKPLCAVDSIIFHDSLKSFFKSQQTDINLLQAVLGLYKDDFLAKDQSEVWIIRHRERLREDYIQGVLLLAELCKQEGAIGEAISYLHNACQKDPLNEQIYEVLMECYLETGYPSRAVQTYKLAEETLMRELGISPGPKLRQLAQKAGLRL